MSALLLPKPTKRLPAERKRIRAVSKRETAKDRVLADALCAQLVKQRAGGACESCGIRAPLDAAHGWPKKAYPAVRYDGRNLWALCRNCHRHYGGHWLDWLAWMGRRLGLADFGALRWHANSGRRPAVSDVIAAARQGRFLVERGE